MTLNIIVLSVIMMCVVHTECANFLLLYVQSAVVSNVVTVSVRAPCAVLVNIFNQV
jgi:hypothetical protein